MHAAATVGATATEIAAAVRAGSVRAEDVVAAHLRAIHDRDPHVNAFVVLRPDDALAEARRIDERPDRGDLVLAGVPVAIKDDTDVAGLPTRNGTVATSPDPAEQDDVHVARLRAAGAVIVGKTSTPELCWYAFTETQTNGTTRNPWRLDRTSGGSSGGTASAIAAGMVPLGTGSDALGSIRIPSAACGLVGMRPGPGVVPRSRRGWEWFDLGENGALATSVGDLATGMSVMADRPLGDLRTGRLRIARSSRLPMLGMPASPAVREGLRLLCEMLEAEGHAVSHEDPPYPFELSWLLTKRWHGAMAAQARSLRWDRLEPRTRRHALVGRLLQRVAPVDPAEAAAVRETMDRWFTDRDVLIAPAIARPPGRAGTHHGGAWLRTYLGSLPYGCYTAVWNLVGFPAVAVPVGMTRGGLPVGVQIVAPRGREGVLLGLAAEIERLRPWSRLAPPPRVA